MPIDVEYWSKELYAYLKSKEQEFKLALDGRSENYRSMNLAMEYDGNEYRLTYNNKPIDELNFIEMVGAMLEMAGLEEKINIIKNGGEWLINTLK